MIRETNQAKLYAIPAQEKDKVLNRSVKRLFDIIFSLILLLFTIPIMLFFCILIALETSGAPIYFQERLGINGKRFYLFKLRSMVSDAEKNGPQWANENDPRITKVGLFIRKTRMDELPQLINILKGDMSFVEIVVLESAIVYVGLVFNIVSLILYIVGLQHFGLYGGEEREFMLDY